MAIAVETNKHFVFEIRKEEDLMTKLNQVQATISPLTQLLSQQSNEQNPFASYAKFDAQVALSTWSWFVCFFLPIYRRTPICMTTFNWLLNYLGTRKQSNQNVQNLFTNVWSRVADEPIFGPILPFANSYWYFSLQVSQDFRSHRFDMFQIHFREQKAIAEVTYHEIRRIIPFKIDSEIKFFFFFFKRS